MKALVLTCLMALPGVAFACPEAPDHSAKLGEIVAALKVSRGSGEARVLSDQLWTLWTDAPDEKAQRLLDMGMQQLAGGLYARSFETLNQLVDYCPDYAEGYNQRAFASYLQRDFAAALVDLDRALEITPNHVAAMAGRGLTLLGLGRSEEAQEQLKAAVALNPWLNERALITEDPGTDI